MHGVQLESPVVANTTSGRGCNKAGLSFVSGDLFKGEFTIP